MRPSTVSLANPISSIRNFEFNYFKMGVGTLQMGKFIFCIISRNNVDSSIHK